MNRARATAHRREGTVDSVTAFSDPLTAPPPIDSDP